MSHYHKPGESFADIPVLTEVVGADIEIPTLTEIIAEEVPALVARIADPAPRSDSTPLSETECRRIAAQISPQLEILLRDKLAGQFEILWQETWREVQAGLPGMIRSQLGEVLPVSGDNSASAAFADSGLPAFGIIP